MESGQVYAAGNGKEYDMLETERLLLRKWTEEDADSLFEYAKDPEVGPIAGWPPHRSREESLDVIRNVLNGRECYAICEKGNPKAIGAIELILNRHNDTEINRQLLYQYLVHTFPQFFSLSAIQRSFVIIFRCSVRASFINGTDTFSRV